MSELVPLIITILEAIFVAVIVINILLFVSKISNYWSFWEWFFSKSNKPVVNQNNHYKNLKIIGYAFLGLFILILIQVFHK